MAYTILIAGKGGTGKTTFAGLFLSFLIKKQPKASVLAVDADPNANLGELFGIDVKDTVVDIVERVARSLDKIPAGMTKDRYIEYLVQDSLVESEGFDLLTMGRPEGPGCYCYANNALRGIAEKLLGGYKYAVIDNEAGMEHLSRRTTRAADIMFLIAEPTDVSVRSAIDIYNLARKIEIKFKKAILIINKVNTNTAKFLKTAKEAGIDTVSEIPYDEELFKLSNEGRPISELSGNSPPQIAVESIFNLTNKVEP